MKWYCVLLGSLLLVDGASAQNADTTSAPVWSSELIGNTSGTQSGFRNWAEGGVNSLALSLGLSGKAEKTASEWIQKHEARLKFGLVKQDTLDFRKAEDQIRLSSTFNFAGQGFLAHIQPTMALIARTQFTEGFNYEKNPFGDGRTPPVKVSDFMAPGTFSQSIGLSVRHQDWFSQRLGVAAKETVVLVKELRPLYSVSSNKSARFELGMEAFSEVDKDVFENVHLKSTLGLFAAFNNPEVPDMIWETDVAMKVNSWLGVNIEWTVLYDQDVSNSAQFREVFSISVAYHFI